MNIKWIGSPNYDTNRKPIDRVVIHWFGKGTLSGVDATFKKEGGTSAHYAIENDTVHQYVKEEHVAYHAGNYGMNQRSIGIEHSAEPERPATDATYNTSGMLLADICNRHGIPLDREHIIGHKEVKATQCPGTMDIDRIIALAKGQKPSVLVPGDVFEKMVQKSSQWDETCNTYNLGDPMTTLFDKLKTYIAGLKSSITDYQNKYNAELTERKNREEQVSRLKAQLTDEVTLRTDLQKQLQEMIDKQPGLVKVYEDRIKVLQGQVDNAGKEIGDLKTQIANLQTEINNLKKDTADKYTVAMLLELLLKKLLPIGRK